MHRYNYERMKCIVRKTKSMFLLVNMLVRKNILSYLHVDNSASDDMHNHTVVYRKYITFIAFVCLIKEHIFIYVSSIKQNAIIVHLRKLVVFKLRKTFDSGIDYIYVNNTNVVINCAHF